tara:strand:+ start:1180 stop:1398 length:219 start_codon:yes stop_codon:yes gene_type:complete
MKRPKEIPWEDASLHPDSEEIREYAREIIELATMLNQFADWVDRSKDTVVGYWDSLEKHQGYVTALAERFKS